MTKELACGDGCGNKVKMQPAQPAPAGWHWNDVLRRWRCPACMRALAAVNQPKPGILRSAR